MSSSSSFFVPSAKAGGAEIAAPAATAVGGAAAAVADVEGVEGATAPSCGVEGLTSTCGLLMLAARSASTKLAVTAAGAVAWAGVDERVSTRSRLSRKSSSAGELTRHQQTLAASSGRLTSFRR